MTATRASEATSSSRHAGASATSSWRMSIQLCAAPKTEVLRLLSRYFTSRSGANCIGDTRRTAGTSVATACTSSNFRLGSTFVSVGMPRVLDPPAWTITMSMVPSMRLKRRMVSCLVASPTEASAVSEAMPMVTPSIMKKLRNGLRDSVRSAR
jgi:hypothetical protein